MKQALLVLIGGGIGSVFRYWLSTSVYAFIGRSFPYGTLAVNVLGCFAMGLLTAILIERIDGNADYLRALLLIGFLGGFTTFSTFSMETLTLLEGGDLLKAVVNILMTVMLCMLAVILGAIWGRQL